MANVRRILKGLAVVVAALLIGSSASLTLFPPKASRIELNQFRAVHSLRELQTAERAFAARNPRLGFTCDLSQLSDAALIDSILAGGDKAGYHFWVTDCATDANGAVIGYHANASPKNSTLGTFSFCSDEQGLLWYTKSTSISDCFNRKLAWERPDPLAR